MSMDQGVIRDFWVETGQGRLLARQWGTDGDLAPILMFHDSLGSIALWRDFPAALAARTKRRVIAYDRLGFGGSDARADLLRADFIADEAARFFPLLRQSLSLDRAVLLGHSVGGAMAAYCAADMGPACRALISIAAQTFPEDRTLSGIREAAAQFQAPQAVERLARYHGDKTKWVLGAWINTWLADDFASWSLDDTLRRVVSPTLALHGGDDEYGSDIHPRTIASLVAGPGEAEIMAGVRHVPHREQPDRVVDRIGAFLDPLG